MATLAPAASAATVWSSRRLQQQPARDSTAARPVVLDRGQRDALAKLGWPPPPPVIPRRDDLIFRRGDGPPLVGSLKSLHAFATVATSGREVHVPREEIGMILVNGRLIPPGAPLLPLDTDAVILVHGPDLLTGRVEVDGEAVHVAGRTVPQAEVALIRLRDPAVAQPPDYAEGPGAGRARGAGGAPATPGAAGAGEQGPPSAAGPSARPRGPGEIPWGEAVWRGTLQFERIAAADNNGKIEASAVERGSYYITWSEEVTLRSTYVLGIRLRPLSLVYQYAQSVLAPGLPKWCQPFTVAKQGSGVDLVRPDFASSGNFSVPSHLPSHSADSLGYFINVFAPAEFVASERPKICDYPTDTWWLAWGTKLPDFYLHSDSDPGDGCTTVPRMPPPYTTIAGEYTCGVRGQPGSAFVRWKFERGVPPPDVSTRQAKCEAARGLVSLARDQRQRAVDRLRQIREEFPKTKETEARLRLTRDQMQGAFDLLLIAAAGSDLGRRLLELVTSDGMLETAGATGRVTEAQRQFIGQLNKFIESYKTWTELADDPGDWGRSKLLGQAQQDAVGEERQQVIDAALEMFHSGQVLADALGQGDGTAALDYIEDNLGALGPLVPEYAFLKARQYVEVTRQWRDALKDLVRLAGDGAKLAYQISEADLGLKVRDRELQDCLNQ